MFSSVETFRYAMNCMQSSLSSEEHSKEFHQEISFEYISDIIKANVDCFASRSFLESQKKLTLALHELKSKINELIKKTEKDFFRIKVQSALQIHDEKMLGHLIAILKDQKTQIKDISCCEMKTIVESIQKSLNHSLVDEKKIFKKMGEFTSKIQKQVADFAKEFQSKVSFQKIQIPFSSLSVNSEKKCHQQQIYIDDDEEENRNIQNIVQKSEKKKYKMLNHRNHFSMFESDKESDGSSPNDNSQNQEQQNKNGEKSNSSLASQQEIAFEKQGNGFKFINIEKKDKKKQSNDEGQNFAPMSNIRYLKIKDLENYPVEEHFNIRLKVLKVIKQFDINGVTNVEFNGGDETGIAVCVMKKNPEITKGNSLYITNCRIYIFKSKIKQIQTSSSSKFYRSNYQIEDIQFMYNFTQESEVLLRRGRNLQKKDGNKNVSNMSKKKNEACESEDKKDKKMQNNGFFTGGCLKICDVEPGDTPISLYAQVVKVIEDGLNIRCVIGDNTGIINAEFPLTMFFIKEGIALKLENMFVDVINCHALIVMKQGVSRVSQIPDVRLKVNENYNMSEIEWLEEYQMTDEYQTIVEENSADIQDSEKSQQSKNAVKKENMREDGKICAQKNSVNKMEQKEEVNGNESESSSSEYDSQDDGLI